MLEGPIVNLANKFLSTYILDLNPTDLKLSILNGEVALHNVRVNTAFLDSLNLPLSVKEVYLGSLIIKFPWRSLSSKPISVEIDDIYVLVTPLDPESQEKEEAVIEEVKEVVEEKVVEEIKEKATEAAEVTEEKPKEEKKAAPTDLGAITDFSGAFDLATALVNNFEFRLNRLHIRLEGNVKSQIPLFSLGIALESIVFDTITPDETVPEYTVRKSFRMDGLSLYWCLNNNNNVLLADTSEEIKLAGLRGFFDESEKSPVVYDKNDRLLDDMHLRVNIVGDLRKIEDRVRSVECCLEETCKKLDIKEEDPVDAAIMNRLKDMDLATMMKENNRPEFSRLVRNSLREEDEQYKTVMGLRAYDIANSLWNLSKTPSPMIRVDVSIEKIDLEIEKSQYENIITFANDFLSSLPASEPVVEEVKPKEIEEKPEELEEKPEEEKVEEVNPHYAFTVISFVCHFANYLFSSYFNFFCFFVLLFTLPVMLFKAFFQALLVLLASVALVGFAYWRLKKRNDDYNSRIDSLVHKCENFVEAGVELKSFELRLNNDMIPNQEVEHLMAICVNSLGVTAEVSKACIRAGVCLKDVHIVDGVASKIQNRNRYLMCVCDVDEQGCPNDIIQQPLLTVGVEIVQPTSVLYSLSKQDIGVKVQVGQINVVLSRVVIYSLLRFIAPSEGMKALLKKAAKKADQMAKELKDQTDLIVEAPPKPIPSNWDRKSIALNLGMKGAQIIMDSEYDGPVMAAGIEELKGEVTICPAKIYAYFNIHDVFVLDKTEGCGLYPEVVSIYHKDDSADIKNDFLDAGVTLFSDDRYPRYPGYSIEANCHIGAPVLTIRMRFINEVLNYIMNGPIMDGLALLSNPEEAEVEVQTVVKSEEELDETHIMENIIDSAKSYGMQYIRKNEDNQEETHIVEHLHGVAKNLKQFIIPNPTDDLVPLEIPKIDVTIANTLIQIPRSSTSPDVLGVRLGKITIRNEEPEITDNNTSYEINKNSIVYTLNKIELKVLGVGMFSTVEGKTNTLMGSIDIGIDVVVAVKIEAAINMGRIIFALSEEQILTLIYLLNENLSEKPVVMKPVEKIVDKAPKPVKEVKQKKVETVQEESPVEVLSQSESSLNESHFLPRVDSSSSFSTVDLNEPVFAVEEKRPEENNSAVGNRIHATIFFEGVSVELFSGKGGYEGVQSSRAIESQMGTVAGSLVIIALKGLGIKAFVHNMNISASVSLSSISIQDSRPDSPIYKNFRTLLQLGEENKPAFALLVGLQQKMLYDLPAIYKHSDHKNESIMDIQLSMFLGQVSVLPSPWIFTLLDWVTGLTTKMAAIFTPASEPEAESLNISEAPSLLSSEPASPMEAIDDEIELTEEDIVVIEETPKKDSLIPNVSVKLHLDRMALYIAEDCCDENSPVFMMCFGTEMKVLVSPFLDINLNLNVQKIRGCRSNNELRLLPTDVSDAIYPFSINMEVNIENQFKKINVNLNGSNLVIRLGVLDAKLLMNAITNLLPSDEEEKPKTEAKPKVEETPKVEEKPKTEEKSEPMEIVAGVAFKNIAFILVNDAKGFDLPVIQFNVDEMKVNASILNSLDVKVILAFSSDYYKVSQSLWEPFIEPWKMFVDVKQVKEEKTSETIEEEEVVEEPNDVMNICVHSPTSLSMNITAPLLSALVETLGDLSGCLSGKREPNSDSFFVQMKNSTGFPMKYHVEMNENTFDSKQDYNINNLMKDLEAHKAKELDVDTVLFSSVVDLAKTYSSQSTWLEIHSAKPHARFYSHIPLDEYPDVEDDLIRTNDYQEINATCGHLFPIAISITNGSRSVYVEEINEKKKEELVSKLSLYNDYKIANEMKFQESNSHLLNERVVPNTGLATQLPCYPSLALMFLNKNYHKVYDRFVSINVEGFEPVSCCVDRESIVYYPMRHESGEQYDALLVNGIKGGKKTIDITSTICIKNTLKEVIDVSFKSDNSVLESYSFKQFDYEYFPLRYAKSGEVTIGTYSLSLQELTSKSIPRCVNIGTQEKPFFIRLVVDEVTTYDRYNKDSVVVYTLRLVPSMSIMNVLPVPVEISVMDQDTTIFTTKLSEGEDLIYNGIPLLAEKKEEMAYRIAIRPEGYSQFTSYANSILPLPQQEPQSAFLESEQPLRVTYNAFEDGFGTLSIQFYVDFWMVNRTGEDIIIQEKGDSKNSVTLPASPTEIVSSKDYKFNKKEVIKPVLFSYMNPTNRSRAILFKTLHSSWCKSGVTIDAIGSYTRFCEPDTKDSEADGKDRVFGVHVSGAPSLFTFSKIITLTPGYFISNMCGYDIAMRLNNDENAETVLKNGETIAYHLPMVASKIEMSVKIDALNTKWSELINTALEEKSVLLELESGEESNYALRMRGGMNNSQREIIFDLADEFNTKLLKKQLAQKKTLLSLKKEEEIDIGSLLKETQEETKDITNLKVAVSFAGFGISLVDAKPQEVLYIGVEKLNVDLTLYTNGKIGVGLTLARFQIDSNMEGSKRPILLGSFEAGQPNPEYQEGDLDVLPEKPFFQLTLIMRSTPSVMYLDYFGLLLQPVNCDIDSCVIYSLLSIVKELSIHVRDADKMKGRKILDNCSDFTNKNVVSMNVGKTYIFSTNFVMQPLNVKFSYKNNPAYPLTNAISVRNSMLTSVLNVCIGASDINAPFTLRSLLLTNMYLEMGAFVKKAVSFYVTEVLGQVYKVFGSLEVIGNPVELIGNVADGVKAFFTEPIQGLMKGPGAFVGGLGKGTTKLVSNLAYGVFNAFGKITSTVSDSVANLAMSEDYQRDRAAGKSNLLHGAWSGVTGVFTETVDGFKSGNNSSGNALLGLGKGVAGAAMGLGKGLVGGVAKVTVGAIDTVTNVTNTIKNIAQEEKVIERLRSPRYIPLNNVLKSYDAYLSDGIALLHKVNSGTGYRMLPNERYVIHFESNNSNKVMMLTTHKVLLCNQKGKLLGVAAYDDVIVTNKGQEMEIRPKVAGSQHELIKSMKNITNELTSMVDGELKLKQDTLVLDTVTLCNLVKVFCDKNTKSNSHMMTLDDMANLVSQMRAEIKGHSCGVEEADPEIKEGPPDITNVGIKNAHYEAKTRNEVNDDKGVKKTITLYKLRVTSDEARAAVWEVNIRYNDLDDLFKLLKNKCNKEDTKNLHLTSQKMKFFKTKNQREEAVRRFIEVLSGSENLLSQPEVRDFLKKGAFNVEWEDEMKEVKDDEVA